MSGRATGVASLFAILIVFLTVPVFADDALAIAKISAGDECILSDGRDVKLEGVQAPGKANPELARQARAFLQSLTQDGVVALDYLTTDRYGRSSAQIYVQKGGAKIWLQGEALKAGMVFLYPPTGNEANVADMQKAENEARQAKRGLWADPAFADVPADKPDAVPYGQFAFVSGKVLKAERVKNKFYLNFGEHWRADFTIAIAAHDLKNFRKAGVDPASYEGKTIRVRGWVIRDFGPMIVVTNPAQIEVIQN